MRPAARAVVGTTTTGTGVAGSSTGSSSGIGVTGTSASTADGATAILGTISSTNPGLDSVGVYGLNNSTTANGIGVFGVQNGTGYGVYGYCGGYGVYGSSGSGTGVYGTSNSGIGVDAYSASNTAVRGLADSTADKAAALQGTITSTSPGGNSAGVLGQNNGTGTNGIGVYGQQNGSGIGVYGYCGGGSGVYGDSTSGTGVTASSASTAVNAAVLSATLTNTQGGFRSAAVYAHNADTGTEGIGVYGQQDGGGYGVWGEADGVTGYGVYGVSAKGTGVYGSAGASTEQLGGLQLWQHRSQRYQVGAGAGGERFASHALLHGESRVLVRGFRQRHPGRRQHARDLEPLFAATVQTDQYHIFLTPQADCNGLYVSAVDAAGFTVRELKGAPAR